MSRSIQIKALEQKIERLSAQLDYLRRIDKLERDQEMALTANTKDSVQEQEGISSQK